MILAWWRRGKSEWRRWRGKKGGREGEGRTLPLPSIGEEEVGRVEERLKDLEMELEGMTGTCRSKGGRREQRREGGREGGREGAYV